MATDKERFNRFFHAMLERGVYFAPALYEAGFVSAAHSDDDIAATSRRAAAALTLSAPPTASVDHRSRRAFLRSEHRPMHIHILGICGTFMGGLAALAREAGHRVTGCDANVYPPMSDQLRALGIELIEGYGADQLALAPDLFVVGNVDHARQPADGGDPRRRRCRTRAARSGSPSTCCRAAMCSPSPARTARPRRPRCWPGSSSRAGLEPGFLVGGVPRNFGVSARLGEASTACALRDRGRRVRHRVLRQAQQVRPLPAAHRDPQQPRVRPRRHLREPGGDRAPVPPPRAHRAGAGPAGRQRREESLQRVLAMGCWSEVQRFGARKEEPGALRARGEPHAFDVLRGSLKIGARRMAAARRAQPAQRAGRDRRRRARRASRPSVAAKALAGFANVRRRLELRGTVDGIAVYDDFAHHPTAIRTTINGLRRKVGRAAHPGGVRAALQHDEARRDEGAAAVVARGSRPRVLPQRRPGLGRRRRRCSRWARRRSSATTIDALVDARRRRGAARRPRAVHEQRRLRRHPPEAARRAARPPRRRQPADGRAVTPPALPARLPLVAAVDQGAQDRPPGSPQHHPDVRVALPAAAASPRDAIRRCSRRHRGLADASAWRSSAARSAASTRPRVAERTGCRAVLLNPAVEPARDLAAHIGETTAWHSDERFDFRAEYVDELRALAAAAR